MFTDKCICIFTNGYFSAYICLELLSKVIGTMMSALRFIGFLVSDMAPYYECLCKDLNWQLDVELLNKMKKANEEELKRLDDVLEDAEKNLGESEIRDAMMAKAEYLIRIGDKVRNQSILIHL